MLPPGTEYIHSYFESRVGAKYPYTLFFGLKPILTSLYNGVSADDIYYASQIAEQHFGNKNAFNSEGWKYIQSTYGKRLPLEIKAIPEGTKVSTGNVLMTVQNTDPKVPWLVGFFETLLSKVWYPSTVATISSVVKDDIKGWMLKSCDNLDGLEFKLHDFGGRSTTCEEQAGIGGAAHLISFRGTDTTRALAWSAKHYHALFNNLGFSVPATEHSVTCAWDNEEEFVDYLLNKYPTGIISVVADTYNIYNFVNTILPKFKDRILARDGKFVVRPDSITNKHKNPADQVVYLLSSLTSTFGSQKNNKGYYSLNPKVGLLWGDGLIRDKINEICQKTVNAGFSIDPLVFGMGTGLLQNCNRDTQRFAFKASSVCINGKWKAIRKNPIDESKASKAGRLKLVKGFNDFETISDLDDGKDFDWKASPNELKTVFYTGMIYNQLSFEEIRLNSDNIWGE